MNEELLNQLRDHGFFLKDGRTNPQASRKIKSFPSLHARILQAVPFMDRCVSFSQIVHALKNNLTELPKCPVCNSLIKFDRPSSSYPTTCSPKCGAVHSPNKTFKKRDITKEPSVLERRIKSRRKKYRTGPRSKLLDSKWLYNKHVVEKHSMKELAAELKVSPATIKLALQQFDILSPTQQELREASNRRKYGVKNVGLLPEVREKARQADCANRVGGWRSSGEKEILTFIQTLLPDAEIEENTQRIISPYELDIYIPSYTLAIEYCGLYWHSDKFKQNYYHRDKMRACKEKGIRLLTVFEDEWRDKREIVESKIKSILGKDDRPRVFARKTHIVNVTTKTKNKFLNENHIQGTGPGSVTYGLIHRDNLVAVMTFIKRSGDAYELNRYATSERVVGGFSKLINHFQSNHKWTQIVSFADLRWSNGDLYEKTGWKLDKDLPPDYYWTQKGSRFHKFGFRHKFLEQRLDHYDPSLSENENCKANGYLKIYNCGLNRYILVNP